MNNKRMSRRAGLIYLVVVITGMFSLAYVPQQLFVYNNPALTFKNILNHEALFRLGISSSVICYTAFIFLPIVLHQLLKPVNESYSKLMILLALLSVPVSFMNLLNKYAILSIVSESKQASLEMMDRLSQQAMSYLNQYDKGIFITTFFWGLWLLPFGLLVFKSEFLPRFLGVLLMLGCLGYVFNFFGNTLFDDYSSYRVSGYLRFLPAIAELGTCCWLLIIGTKSRNEYAVNA